MAQSELTILGEINALDIAYYMLSYNISLHCLAISLQFDLHSWWWYLYLAQILPLLEQVKDDAAAPSAVNETGSVAETAPQQPAAGNRGHCTFITIFLIFISCYFIYYLPTCLIHFSSLNLACTQYNQQINCWSTNVLITCCSPMMKEYNCQTINMSVMPFCHWLAACT